VTYGWGRFPENRALHLYVRDGNHYVSPNLGPRDGAFLENLNRLIEFLDQQKTRRS
jgi:hypothetical protein